MATIRMRSCCSLAALVLSSCLVEVSDAPPDSEQVEVAVQAHALAFDINPAQAYPTNEWELMTSAHAVFEFPAPVGCTAAMISAEVAISAAHCSRTEGNVTFLPGRDASAYIERRKKELRLTSDFDFQNGFFCRLLRAPLANGTDISAVECPAVELNGQRISPGEFWGTVRLRRSSDPALREDDRITLIGQANASNDALQASRGQILDLSPRLGNSPYPNSFAHDATTALGWSGSPVFSTPLTDGRPAYVIGVHWGADDGTGVAAYLPAVLSQYLQEPISQSRLISSSLQTTAWVGGSGGSRRELRCPDDYVATGVTGTTYNGGHRGLGNLGIICSPYHRFGNSRSVDKDLVFAGGSRDTHLQVVKAKPYFDYRREYPQMKGDWARALQKEARCPAGTYLKGVIATELPWQPTEIAALRCGYPHSSSFETHWLQESARIGEEPGVDAIDSRCSGDRAVTGLNVNSGWWTDGFQFTCNRLVTAY